MNELKPCPFCGGEASIVESSNGMMNVMYSIGCDTPCRMSPSLMAFNREEAITEWNNRQHENKIGTNEALNFLSIESMPDSIKGKMTGEFSIEHTETCSACAYDYPDEECEVCGGKLDYQVEVNVPWGIQKDIIKMFLKCAKDDLANIPN